MFYSIYFWNDEEMFLVHYTPLTIYIILTIERIGSKGFLKEGKNEMWICQIRQSNNILLSSFIKGIWIIYKMEIILNLIFTRIHLTQRTVSEFWTNEIFPSDKKKNMLWINWGHSPFEFNYMILFGIYNRSLNSIDKNNKPIYEPGNFTEIYTIIYITYVWR